MTPMDAINLLESVSDFQDSRGRLLKNCREWHVVRANALSAANCSYAGPMIWECGCGALNGVNLDMCGYCHGPRRDRTALTFEVAKSRNVEEEWRVEAIDLKSDGDVYVALFSGPEARQLAEEYAAFKNNSKPHV